MTDRNDQQLAKLHHRLLHGKLPSTLKWTEVVELIQHLGRVEPQGRNDEYAFIVGGHREVFHQPHTHGELSALAVSQLRKFLRQRGGRRWYPRKTQSAGWLLRLITTRRISGSKTVIDYTMPWL